MSGYLQGRAGRGNEYKENGSKENPRGEARFIREIPIGYYDETDLLLMS